MCRKLTEAGGVVWPYMLGGRGKVLKNDIKNTNPGNLMVKVKLVTPNPKKITATAVSRAER